LPNDDVITNLSEAFKGLFTNAPEGVTNGLYDALQGRMYEDEAESGAAYPYAVFSIISSPKDRTFTEVYRDSLLQLDLFSEIASGASVMKNIHYQASKLYDECAMTITGSTLIWCRETNFIKSIEDIETTTSGTSRVYHWILEYDIRTSLN